MNHSLEILSIGVKFPLYLVHLWRTLSFNSNKPQNFSVIFDFGLLEWRVVKNCTRDFWLHFYFLWHWLMLHFFSFEIGTKNRKFFTTHFLKTRRHGSAQWLFSQLYTAFKGITPKIFWVRSQTLYAYKESSEKT